MLDDRAKTDWHYNTIKILNLCRFKPQFCYGHLQLLDTGDFSKFSKFTFESFEIDKILFNVVRLKVSLEKTSIELICDYQSCFKIGEF